MSEAFERDEWSTMMMDVCDVAADVECWKRRDALTYSTRLTQHASLPQELQKYQAGLSTFRAEISIFDIHDMYPQV